ncbi:MAG TPA: lysophospholipid acyltransferase family protein [Blastocatellia bacterium]
MYNPLGTDMPEDQQHPEYSFDDPGLRETDRGGSSCNGEEPGKGAGEGATDREKMAPEGATESIPRPANRKHKRQSDLDLKRIRRRAYGFDDLSKYTLSERIIIRIADLALTCLLSLIGTTMRWQANGAHDLDAILETGSRVIFVFWHVCTLTSCWFWRDRGVVIMSSRSRDGEYTARFIKRFGYGTARGSSTRGSRRAMVELTECLASGVDAAFTIDGPRGPAYVAKEGAVTLARHTGCPILPFHIAVHRFLELPSWDRTHIPLPFTRAITLIGRPIYVSRFADPAEVARKQSEMQTALDELCRMGEQWRKDPAGWKPERNEGRLPHATHS